MICLRRKSMPIGLSPFDGVGILSIFGTKEGGVRDAT